MTTEEIRVLPGTTVFREVNGVAGTHEIQVYHDGVNGHLICELGTLFLATSGGSISIDASGNLVANNITGSSSGSNTGDQTITLTGDVTGSGTGSFATAIAANAVTTTKINNAAVTYAKIQNVTASKLLGNPTGGAAAPSEIALGTNLTFTSGTLNTTGLGTGTVTSITAGSGLGGGTITSAGTLSVNVDGSSIQLVSGTLAMFISPDFNIVTAGAAKGLNARLVGNGMLRSAFQVGPPGYDGSGFYVDISNGSDRGTIVSGDFIAIQGASMSVAHNTTVGSLQAFLATTFGTGSVTSVASGTGLTGGPVTASGTISVAANGITNALFRQSAATTIVGNTGTATGNVADISIGSGLLLGTNGTLSIGTTVVTGPASSTANAIATFTNTSGNAIQNTSVTLDSNNTITSNKNSGNSRVAKYFLWNTTTNATQTQLFIDGASTQLVLQNNTSMHFKIQLVGRRTGTAGSSLLVAYTGAISRDGSAATTALIGDISQDQIINPSALDWAVSITADTTGGALKIQVTGDAATNISWGASVETLEITG